MNSGSGYGQWHAAQAGIFSFLMAHATVQWQAEHIFMKRIPTT